MSVTVIVSYCATKNRKLLRRKWGSINSMKFSGRIGDLGSWESQSAKKRCKSGFYVCKKNTRCVMEASHHVKQNFSVKIRLSGDQTRLEQIFQEKNCDKRCRGARIVTLSDLSLTRLHSRNLVLLQLYAYATRATQELK